MYDWAPSHFESAVCTSAELYIMQSGNSNLTIMSPAHSMLQILLTPPFCISSWHALLVA